MRQQRKAEARAVAAVVDADALAEQEAKALELQVRGVMSWCAQQVTALVWNILGARLSFGIAFHFVPCWVGRCQAGEAGLLSQRQGAGANYRCSL